jgi:hypothetical protein
MANESESFTDKLYRRRANLNYAVWLTGAIFVGAIWDLAFKTGFIQYIRDSLGMVGVIAAFSAFPIVVLRRWLVGREYVRAISFELSLREREKERSFGR